MKHKSNIIEETNKQLTICAYEISRRKKLNVHFDKFVDKIGGKWRAIWLLFFAFVVFISSIFFIIVLRQQNQRLVFSDTEFTMVSIDRAASSTMSFRDQEGYMLVFTSSRYERSFYYRGSQVSVNIQNMRHNYFFSDGSMANNSRPRVTRPNSPMNLASPPLIFPVGAATHFTPLQQTESLMLYEFWQIYSGYTDTVIFVRTVIFTSIFWFFSLLITFLPTSPYKITRRVDTFSSLRDKMREERLIRLNGQACTITLIVMFIIVTTLAIAIINIPWWSLAN